MAKVLVFGTFDIFHEGHKDFLRQARKHGDFVRVIVARNVNVLNAKGRLPRFSEAERIQEIKKSGLADEVFPGSLDDRYSVLREFKPDVVCLGYDQKQSVAELRRKLNELGMERTRIVRLDSYEPQKYKSSILRKKLDE